ncbi:unnamed protein product [Rotaria socialis]|uniref:Uncharacterized protein n=1 Tax=Rotaria socialis TaxID=392032 RepID=A0A817LWW3_9BILA|nr:unnamed protein product [Rotaria socialis]CAF3366198.1 unnamed protein product [Rotaria socialis]CAF3411730.1 unnamed protein product [Rotaria socialis]CAF3414034.1 unnamed protein product [Rotaria socialis]CAF3564337.1 unnamed protein product [Rotaria socialis]
MGSWDAERKRKLNEDFDNIFHEHERLQKDLNINNNPECQSLLQSIDRWEQDAIKKIKKTAKIARNDVQRLLKSTHDRLQIVLYDSVTEKLQETLTQKVDITEDQIDQWLINLSEIRKQLERVSSTVDFSHDTAIDLIKVKQKKSSDALHQTNFDYQQFYFEKIRGHPVFYNTQHLISATAPITIVSQNKYSAGTHYFRFSIEKPTDELFFGVISDTDLHQLKQNIRPIASIYGWWNIDRRVIEDRKEPYVSTLNLNAGDEVILTLNCNAREIFLEYPSMWKSNSIKLPNKGHVCPPPWRLLIETGKPRDFGIKLLDWGITAHGKNHPDKRLHCYCKTD